MVQRPASVERAQRWTTRIDSTVWPTHYAVLALPARDKLDGKGPGITIYFKRFRSGGQMFVKQLLNRGHVVPGIKPTVANRTTKPHFGSMSHASLPICGAALWHSRSAKVYRASI